MIETDNMDEKFSNAPLAWPLIEDDICRFNWYSIVINDYLNLWNRPDLGQLDHLKATEEMIENLEKKLDCKLPKFLSHYHPTFGITDLAEVLCDLKIGSSTCIDFLLNSYPRIVDMNLSKEDLKLASDLINFSDYLGNGNISHIRSLFVQYRR